MITIGCAIAAFAIITINLNEKLADGGVTGMSLIFKHVFNINPALTIFVFNVPLVILAVINLKRGQVIRLIYGFLNLTFFVWLFGQLNIALDLKGDILIAAILSGILVGIGYGIVFRFDGLTGGTDILSRILNDKFNIPMGTFFFLSDAVVLVLSLVYLDIRLMIYSLIYVAVASVVVNKITASGSHEKGIYIFSDENDAISEQLIADLDLGVTHFHGHGGYYKTPKDILYVVASTYEVRTIVNLIQEHDKDAFVSVVDVQETHGEGFTFKKTNKKEA
jgi:uncharacterized membrane-anchored protein YitT (DUF2179 family)